MNKQPTVQEFIKQQASHTGIYSHAQVNQAVTRLDRLLLGEDGRIKLMPARHWKQYNADDLRIWCWSHAIYAIPTLELVDWLKASIGGRSAIEIGSGNNDLGYYLGIKQTDSCCQTLSEVKAYYAMLEQPATNPRPDVEQIEALGAVAKHKPQVVIGSWITQLWHPSDGDGTGSVLGVDEEALLKSGIETYIHVGHRRIHSHKRVLQQKHNEYNFPWHLGRTKDQAGNYICVWEQ
jgi:hypothetical protein